MSERTEYAPGTPSWVDHTSAEPAKAAEFYAGLFGWETENRMPAESGGEYHIATLRGKEVAALGSQPMEGVPTTWNTYVTVASADETVGRVAEAGGTTMVEPFDVFEAGRMAVCADPAGAAFTVWEPRESIGAELVNEPGTLSWNELTTRDAEGSKAFYGAVFGWKTREMEFAGGEYTIWQLAEQPDEGGIGGMMPMVGDAWPADMPPRWMVYFAVADTDASAARCEELGGTVNVPAFDAPGVGRVAVLSDRQGAVFSIITLSPEAQGEPS